MPGHEVHKFFERLLLGKVYPEVHRAIDRPYLIFGKKHRALFHDPFSAYMMVSMTSSDPKASLAGLWHIWLDEKCSQDRKFKRDIEWATKLDKRWRRHLRRQRKAQKRLEKMLKRINH